jgi:hypothetical protein
MTSEMAEGIGPRTSEFSGQYSMQLNALLRKSTAAGSRKKGKEGRVGLDCVFPEYVQTHKITRSNWFHLINYTAHIYSSLCVLGRKKAVPSRSIPYKMLPNDMGLVIYS